MIDSMFLGIFAGMFSCLVALLLNCKLAQSQDVDPDTSKYVTKTCMYLLMTSLICFGAVIDYTIGSLAVTAHTLFGIFAFVVADECVNSSLFGRLTTESD